MPIGRRLPVLFVASLVVMACGRTELDQPGDDASGSPTGVAGTGGSPGPGTGGNGGDGAGGTGGAGGLAVGGAGGRGGTTGAAGRGGTTGSAGIGGRGGTTGAAGVGGTTGSAGRGGTTGAAGRGGTTGSAGVSGTTGAAGRGGTTGAAGRGGRSGNGGTTGTGGQPPVPIPCGQMICTPGTQSCCVTQAGATCIAAGAPCMGGANIGCLEGSACMGGNVCCLSLLGGATSCVTSATCNFAGGVILCSGAAQCPNTAPNCCRFGQVGVCRAQSCM